MGVIGAMKRILGANPRKINLRNLSGYPDRDNLMVVIDSQSITCRYSIGSLNSKTYVLNTSKRFQKGRFAQIVSKHAHLAKS